MKDKNLNSSISLAVLPFNNYTGNIEHDYFSRGFVEDLITDLSRFPNFNIISSTTTFSNEMSDDFTSAEKYGINYFLKGSLRKIGDNIRIITQLVNPFNQSILWAEKYDAPIEQIFEIHDNIIAKVVSSLSVKIDSEKLASIRKKDIAQLEVYDSWLRGYEYLRRGTIKDDEKARDVFKHALSIDPHCGRAYAGLSLSYFNEWTCQLWDRWDENISAAQEYAQKASVYSANDHIVQMILGRVLLYRRNYELAAQHIEKALELNPNDADNLVQIASCKGLLGDVDEAVALFKKAVRLNPLHFNWYYIYGTMIYFAAEDYEELIRLAEAVSPTMSVDLPAYLAIAYAFKSNFEKASYYINLYQKTFKEKITYGREPQPGEAYDWVIAVNPYKEEKDVKRMMKGLELAGLDKNEIGKNYFSNDVKPKGFSNTFKKEKKLWLIAFNNLSVQLPEVKGFLDISKLLENPEKEIHCSELMGNVTNTDGGVETVDEKAKRKYYAKIKDLKEELAEAEEMNDFGKTELINNELNQILEHLSQATGLLGRSRKLADPSDRARAAVTLRIKSAIQKIENVHPSLAKHFQNNIKTGTFCVYSPENPVTWDL